MIRFGLQDFVLPVDDAEFINEISKEALPSSSSTEQAKEASR